MLYKQFLELFDILDSASASGAQVVEYFKSIAPDCKVETYPLNGPKGHTDMVRLMVPGKNGKTNGGTAKTLGILGRLGGLGARPERILAAVGPCIGPCCFETDSDVPEAMRASALGAEAEPYLERRGAKYHVDLAGLNRQWLLHAGVTPEHIDVCGLCTACRPDLFWSHRKMGNARGAQVAMICL